MKFTRFFLLFTVVLGVSAADATFWQSIPPPTANSLTVIAPSVLELTSIQTKAALPARLSYWDFVAADSTVTLPEPTRFVVTVDGQPAAVLAVGFKRRVAYAPLRRHDLRVASWLYLVLETPVRDHQTIEVTNPDTTLWPSDWKWQTRVDPNRLGSALHVNQVGYAPDQPKKAMVGYYLGTLHELKVDPASGFELIDADSSEPIYRGKLTPRPDAGFPYPAYTQVLEADFSDCREPGRYRLRVPGLGASLPFVIGESVPAALARTLALGLYHLRCGGTNTLPFTRFVHDACHTVPANVPVPEPEFAYTWATVASYGQNPNANNPTSAAPALANEASQLYPFVNRGPIDVSGGHHDAGDYSKYTINSASLVHTLLFGVDSLPGTAALDNLGLPESGDGIGDLLQTAKWEIDFIAKLQDADGGFYFLVYPREREYEAGVPPDRGDPQVVWPKNTAATAAAVAALAEAASSPELKRHYPADAARYLEKARLGWDFLKHAFATYGESASYQKLTHYGDDFTHDDEVAWAAAALYAATGEADYAYALKAWYNPSSSDTWRWGWWHAYMGFGNAARTYAFAARSGRLPASALDRDYLLQCENELIAAAEDQLRWARQSAYGTSFPEPTKRFRSGGWYFSTDASFDLAVAAQLSFPRFNDPRPDFMDALYSNFNYTVGTNPTNTSYLTGLGWKRPVEIVSQYAQSSPRLAPPHGLLVGQLTAGYSWVDVYQNELNEMSFPPDGDLAAPYALYDRSNDAYNVTNEGVVTNQGRALSTAAWLMAQTPLKTQAWTPKSVSVQISGLPKPKSPPIRTSVTLAVNGVAFDRSPLARDAQIVWETSSREPTIGSSLDLTSAENGWIEAEIEWPDGRRVFTAADRSGAEPPPPSSKNPKP